MRNPEVKELMNKWLENREDYQVTREVADKLVPLLEKSECENAKRILSEIKITLLNVLNGYLVVMDGLMILAMVD